MSNGVWPARRHLGIIIIMLVFFKTTLPYIFCCCLPDRRAFCRRHCRHATLSGIDAIFLSGDCFCSTCVSLAAESEFSVLYQAFQQHSIPLIYISLYDKKFCYGGVGWGQVGSLLMCKQDTKLWTHIQPTHGLLSQPNTEEVSLELMPQLRKCYSKLIFH